MRGFFKNICTGSAIGKPKIQGFFCCCLAFLNLCSSALEKVLIPATSQLILRAKRVTAQVQGMARETAQELATIVTSSEGPATVKERGNGSRNCHSPAVNPVRGGSRDREIITTGNVSTEEADL